MEKGVSDLATTLDKSENKTPERLLSREEKTDTPENEAVGATREGMADIAGAPVSWNLLDLIITGRTAIGLAQ